MRARRHLTTQPGKLSAVGPFLSIPDWPVANEGAFVLELWMRLSDWTPAASIFPARHGFGDGQLCWSLEIQPSGRPRANYYDLGTLATRIGTEANADPGFVNGEAYGLRVSWLSDLFGVASAYIYEVNYGARWQQLGSLTQAALVGVPFDSIESMAVGPPGELLDIYSVRAWTSAFGSNQITHERRALDANLANQAPGTVSWPDLVTPSITWTNGFGNLVRSERPMPYAA